MANYPKEPYPGFLIINYPKGAYTYPINFHGSDDKRTKGMWITTKVSVETPKGLTREKALALTVLEGSIPESLILADLVRDTYLTKLVGEDGLEERLKEVYEGIVAAKEEAVCEQAFETAKRLREVGDMLKTCLNGR